MAALAAPLLLIVAGACQSPRQAEPSAARTELRLSGSIATEPGPGATCPQCSLEQSLPGLGIPILPRDAEARRATAASSMKVRTRPALNRCSERDPVQNPR